MLKTLGQGFDPRRQLIERSRQRSLAGIGGASAQIAQFVRQQKTGEQQLASLIRAADDLLRIARLGIEHLGEHFESGLFAVAAGEIIGAPAHQEPDLRLNGVVVGTARYDPRTSLRRFIIQGSCPWSGPGPNYMVPT